MNTHSLIKDLKLLSTSILIGTPPQPVTLLIDTGSTDIVVNVYTSEFCKTATCYLNGLFDPTISTTRAQVNRKFRIAYEDSSRARGDFITDVIRIGHQPVDNVQIGLALESDRVSGVLGIGYALNEANVIQDGKQMQDTYPTLFERLFSSRLIKIMASSIWWDNPSSGSLLFGGVDTAKFSGNLITVPIVKQNGRYQHLKVKLSDVELPGVSRSHDPSEFTKRGPIVVFFDTGAVATYFPSWLTYEVWNVVGARLLDSDGFPFVKCDIMKSDLKFDLIFGSNRISIPLSTLIYQKGGDCKVLVMENPNTSKRDGGILGANILSALYVVFDITNHEISMARVKRTQPPRSNVEEYSQYRQKKTNTKNNSLQSFIPEDGANSVDELGELAAVPSNAELSSFPESNEFAPELNPESLNAGAPLADVNEPTLAQTPPTSNNPISPLSNILSPPLAENSGGAATLNAPSESTYGFTLKQKDGTSKDPSLSTFSADPFAMTQTQPNPSSPQFYSTEFSAFNPLVIRPTILDASTSNSANLVPAIDPNKGPPAQNSIDHTNFLSPSSPDGSAVISNPKFGEGTVPFTDGQSWLQGWNEAINMHSINALATNT